MKNNKANFKFSTNPENSSSVAYVLENLDNNTIYFTDKFNSLRDRGNGTFSGTIFHEYTHLALGTSDITYDVVQMKNTLTSRQKYFNAKNWQYFYEGVFKYGTI